MTQIERGSNIINYEITLKIIIMNYFRCTCWTLNITKTVFGAWKFVFDGWKLLSSLKIFFCPITNLAFNLVCALFLLWVRYEDLNQENTLQLLEKYDIESDW